MRSCQTYRRCYVTQNRKNQAERRVAELRGNALFSDAEASRERALTKRILLQAILQAPTPFEKMRRVSQPVAPVSHEESLNCGAGGVFHESQEKRPLTTQDILEHEDSFDCGGDAGDIVMGVQEDSFVPRRIRKKQPRPDGTRLPFFHHFFARTVLTAEEQQIIDDINAFGLCPPSSSMGFRSLRICAVRCSGRTTLSGFHIRLQEGSFSR